MSVVSFSVMIVRAILRMLWITFDVLLCIPLYFILLACVCWLRLVWSYAFWEFESWIFRELNQIVGYWIWSAETTIVEYGELPFRKIDERCLVIVNHQSMADVPTLCATLCKKGASGGKIAWVLDEIFRWTPFGLVNQVHGDYFIQEGQLGTQAERLANNLKSAYLPRGRRWYIVFPEGGFLCNRLVSSQNYARRLGFPVLQHCVLPRLGAVKAMIDTLNPAIQQPVQNAGAPANGPGLPEGALPCCVPRRRIHPDGFRYLVDVTIGYQNGSALSVWALLFAHHAPCEVGLHYRVIRAEDVPHNNDVELRDFLYDLWREKERKLAHFNRFGHFPHIPREEGTVVDFHLAGMISRHVMFMVIAYFVYGYLSVWIYHNIRALLFR